MTGTDGGLPNQLKLLLCLEELALANHKAECQQCKPSERPCQKEQECQGLGLSEGYMSPARWPRPCGAQPLPSGRDRPQRRGRGGAGLASQSPEHGGAADQWQNAVEEEASCHLASVSWALPPRSCGKVQAPQKAPPERLSVRLFSSSTREPRTSWSSEQSDVARAAPRRASSKRSSPGFTDPL